ncbi:MAG: hypothetical protein K6G00_10185 [Treponema sp.]|nr:hypothetical protein [Treponema sp.]
MIPLSNSDDKSFVTAGTNDAITVTLPEDLTFVEGIEIMFKVPQEVAYWMDSVAWSLYNDIKPDPTEKRIDYRGNRNAIGTFGNSLSLVLKIPLKKENTIKRDAYSTYIEDIPDFLHNKIFLRMQMVMKGTPSSLSDAEFEVSAKPIYINKGKLSITVRPPDNISSALYNVFIDDTPISKLQDIMITPGIHTVHVTSDSFRNENKTITIEQAKNHTLDIKLRDITPIIRIAAPDNSKIQIDDKVIDYKGKDSLPIAQGMHTIRISVGGYEIVKTVNAINGHTYSINTNLDATITEEE